MTNTEIIKRAKNIIIEPQREFVRISKEQKGPASLLFEFLLPFLVLNAIVFSLSAIVIYKAGIAVIIKRVLIDSSVLVISIYLSSLIINEILPYFQKKKDASKIFSLISYSLTPFYIAAILSGFIPKLSVIFNLFIIYSIYVLWIATSILIDMKKEHKIIFVLLSVFTFLLVFLFNRLILGYIFLT